MVESFPLDPHTYTPKEFLELLNDGRMTALDALTEGIVIHVEQGFLNEAVKALENALKSRRKVGKAWIPLEPP